MVLVPLPPNQGRLKSEEQLHYKLQSRMLFHKEMVDVSKLVFFLHCIPAESFNKLHPTTPKLGILTPLYVRLTTSLSSEGTWTWVPISPGYPCSYFGWIPSFCSLPRHSQTDPLSQKLSFIPSIFPKKSFTRSSQPALSDCMWHSAQETSHTVLCPTKCNFKPTPKLVFKILQIYMGKNEIKLCHMFLGLLWYK